MIPTTNDTKNMCPGRHTVVLTIVFECLFERREPCPPPRESAREVEGISAIEQSKSGRTAGSNPASPTTPPETGRKKKS